MKRAFDKEVLKLLVWDDCADPAYEYVATVDTGDSRWSSHHQVIFRFEGALWASDYSKGLSESQDQVPYEQDEAEAYEVEAITKTTVVTEYVAKKDNA